MICAVDRGTVRGMLTTLYDGDATALTEATRTTGDPVCITAVAG